MKNSSRGTLPKYLDKPNTSTSQNRLNKTQQPQQPKSDYLDNTYHIEKKATVYEKPYSDKAMLPPRTGSSQKINYKVEDNMTTSKIQ